MVEWVAFLANIATALGIPIAVVAFLNDRKRTREQRELETFTDMSDRYFQYLQVVFENPELSTTETEWARSGRTATDVRQDIVVQMAVNMVEAAFFLYRDHRSDFKQAQWKGWEEYLMEWCAHPAFMSHWPEVVEQYDENFRALTHRLYERVHRPNGKASPENGDR